MSEEQKTQNGQPADKEVAGGDLSKSVHDFPAGMAKVIVTSGEGDEHPVDGCEVSVHYRGTLLDGTEFDSSYKRDEPFNFTIGSGSVIRGWDLAVKSMLRGETSEFTLPPELAYGESGCPPTIPPNATLCFKIELLDWETSSDQKSIYKMSPDERIAICKEKKEAGGALFKKQNYDAAIRQYRDLMKYAESAEYERNLEELDVQGENFELQPQSEEEQAKRKELKQMLLVGHLNLAMCYLKLKKIKECLENCESALDIDPVNVKAIYRKGLAYMLTNDLEKALEQYKKVLQIDPNNSEAKTQLNATMASLKAYYEKQKNLYKNLFAPK